MPRRLSLILTLTAWLLATGSHWDLVQTFGWGRMILRNSELMPFSQAVNRTFSGEMCGICRAVSQAKQQEQQAPLPPEGGAKAKMVMLCPPAPQFVVFAPEHAPWPPGDQALLSVGRPAPPTPPPRLA
ncbi:MAG TPA: hypothetical protein VGD81_01480 [Opitutaceae bacterium]